MAEVKISGSGNPALDGNYPFDTSFFTNRELHTIKEVAGVRAGEIEDALHARDNDLVVAIALITLRRAGKQVPTEALWDLPAGKIVLDLSDPDAGEDADALPPVSEPDGTSGAAVTLLPSGRTSSGTSDPQENDQRATGDQTSDMSAVSA